MSEIPSVPPSGADLAGDADVSPAPAQLAPSEVTRRGRRSRRVQRVTCWAVGLLLVVLAGRAIDRSLRPQLRGTELQVGTRPTLESRRGDAITARLDRPRAADEHPLAPAIEVAKAALQYFRENVRDYTAVFIKQERVGEQLAESQQCFLKIRQAAERDGQAVPFSVYLRFQEPDSVAGREVIYVAGHNQGRLTAHEGGLLGLATVHLAPTSKLAMRGNRYPITEIGIETMIRRMIEKGERDARLQDCQVTINRDLTVGGHPATQIEIKHPEPSAALDFHIARILIDDALNVPIAYESYAWPRAPGADPELLERYQYANLQLNVGLTDRDFDTSNAEYAFPWAGR